MSMFARRVFESAPAASRRPMTAVAGKQGYLLKSDNSKKR